MEKKSMKTKLIPKKTMIVAALFASGLAAQAQDLRANFDSNTKQELLKVSLDQEQVASSEFTCGISCGVSCKHTVS